MKLGIFDPYLDTLGGGERYSLSLAEALLTKGWQVDIFWPDSTIKSKLSDKFGLNLDKLNFVEYSPEKLNILQRRNFENKYDAIFWISDGSIPLMFSKLNLLHFQVPFKHVLHKDCLTKIKLTRIDHIVCNSLFTKKNIDNYLGVKSAVLYPPVDIAPIKPGKKENIILSVGRFSQLLQGKSQDVLVEAFIEMVKNYDLKGWKLVLVGGSEVGGREFVRKLKEMSQGYKIDILENLPFSKLLALYGKAKIFWTASGFGINEQANPEKVEHFGMTTVEAMAGGCVPVVMDKGGQKEIVDRDKTGLLWQTQEELIRLTLALIKSKKVMTKLAENAILRSKDFSKEKFNQHIYSLINL